jgi:hypothetical protein
MWQIFILDLHVVYTTIDTYTHNAGGDSSQEGSQEEEDNLSKDTGSVDDGPTVTRQV